MSIDPRMTTVRTCVVCQDADVHDTLFAHCGPCHVQFLVDIWSDDDHIAAAADGLDVELLAIEVEPPRTSSGECTVDIGDHSTVDHNGNAVRVA